MTLTELWTAMIAGEHSALERAYLHRIMRERGGELIKGREDVAADWANILATGPKCTVIVDIGDMAIIDVGDATYHHWVRREAGRIVFEVLISGAEANTFKAITEVVERRVDFEGQAAELFHIFGVGVDGEQLRRAGSRILATGHNTLSGPIPNS